MSIKVIFRYSLEKDAENWIYRIFGGEKGFIPIKNLYSHYPVDIVEKLRKAKNKKDALGFMIQKIKSPRNAKLKLQVIQEEMKVLERVWGIIQKDFFNILSKILKAPIYRNDFTVYFSTFPLCRFNEKENYFNVSSWSSIPSQINTIAHELLHFQFLAIYRKNLEKSGLTENQIQNLKEALTFLLNEKEFQAILLLADRGYPEHKDFRKELKNIWEKEKNFSLFLPKAIKLTKKLYKK